MKLSEQVFNKAEEMLFNDKINSSKIGDFLSSEIYYVLRQYFEINKDSFLSQIFVENSGDINISFSFKAKRVLIKRERIHE